MSSILDIDGTTHRDLRGGTPPWIAGFERPVRKRLEQDLACEILVVGAGITGALLAEHLTALGHGICVIDRERAGFGSTAASTAMLQWEIDCSLSELTKYYGFERAAGIYRRSFQAAAGLKQLIEHTGVWCGYRPRQSLYLASSEAEFSCLRDEHKLRARAGLPGAYLDYPTLRREFNFDRQDAILSPGSAEADPILLAHGLLSQAIASGAKLFDAQAETYENFGHGVVVGLDNGHRIEAKKVILATGYVMPDFIKTDIHSTASSWAIATPRQAPEALWPNGALIWEASDNYLYARTTVDSRIVIGGEDDSSVIDPDCRDALMAEKAAIILAKLSRLQPMAAARAEFAWSGAFGETVDGLPLIGQAPGMPSLFAAYGYGGNGITFSYLASRMIGKMLAGERAEWFDDFALDRSVPR